MRRRGDHPAGANDPNGLVGRRRDVAIPGREAQPGLTPPGIASPASRPAGRTRGVLPTAPEPSLTESDKAFRERMALEDRVRAAESEARSARSDATFARFLVCLFFLFCLYCAALAGRAMHRHPSPSPSVANTP